MDQASKGTNRNILMCLLSVSVFLLQEHCFSNGGVLRNSSMSFLSIEVLAALGSTLKKELIDSSVSLWLLR